MKPFLSAHRLLDQGLFLFFASKAQIPAVHCILPPPSRQHRDIRMPGYKYRAAADLPPASWHGADSIQSHPHFHSDPLFDGSIQTDLLSRQRIVYYGAGKRILQDSGRNPIKREIPSSIRQKNRKSTNQRRFEMNCPRCGKPIGGYVQAGSKAASYVSQGKCPHCGCSSHFWQPKICSLYEFVF